MVCIYKLVNKVKNKVYIGKSANLKNIWEIYNGLRENEKLALESDIKNYGFKNFEFAILEECLEKDSPERENYYINLYNMQNQKSLLNSEDEEISEIKPKVKKKAEHRKSLNPGLKKHMERMKTDSDYRAKMIQKYKNNRPNAISINMLRKTDGEILKTFSKIMEGAAWIRENTKYKKADYATINKVCKGKGKTAYGYKWAYVDKVQV